MATKRDVMEQLHIKVATSLTRRLDQDMEDNIPTDAATMSAAIKFLKDNDITADPADADDLSKLRDKLSQSRKAKVLSLAKSDMQNVAEG